MGFLFAKDEKKQEEITKEKFPYALYVKLSSKYDDWKLWKRFETEEGLIEYLSTPFSDVVNKYSVMKE